VSASADGTTADYSKGALLRRRDLRTLRGLLAAIAVAGAALLLIAELSPLYTVVVGSLETPRRSVTAGSNHGYALALVALAALVMTGGAFLRAARAAAVALVALGAVALFVALAIDLPDTRQSGTLAESVTFSRARAKAASGFALELAGAVALVVAGAGLLVLGSARREGGGADGGRRDRRPVDRAHRQREQRLPRGGVRGA
jgi:hypothetical protein